MYRYSTRCWKCDCDTGGGFCNGSTGRSNYPRHPRNEYVVEPILPFSCSPNELRGRSRLLEVIFELSSRVGKMYRICGGRRRIWCHGVGRARTSHTASSSTGCVGGVNLLKPEPGGLPWVAGKPVLNTRRGTGIGWREIFRVRRELECRSSAIRLRNGIRDGSWGGSRLSWWTSSLKEHPSFFRRHQEEAGKC